MYLHYPAQSRCYMNLIFALDNNMTHRAAPPDGHLAPPERVGHFAAFDSSEASMCYLWSSRGIAWTLVSSELDYSVKKHRGHHSISFGQIQLINDILYSKRTERGRDVMFLTKLSRWRHLGLSSETILLLFRLRIFDGLFLRFDARVSISTWHIIEKGQREQLKDQPKEKHHNDDQVHRPNHRYQYSMRTFVLV